MPSFSLRWTLLAIALGGTPAAAQQDPFADKGLARNSLTLNEDAPQVPVATVAERVLDCTVAHATNIDPAVDQRPGDIVYGQTYAVTLALSAGTVPLAQGPGTGEPDAIPPVGYRVIADREGLFRGIKPGFSRVADYWPKHVELGQTVSGAVFAFVLLDSVPDQPKLMSIYIARAQDAVSVDSSWIHRGTCTIRGAKP